MEREIQGHRWRSRNREQAHVLAQIFFADLIRVGYNIVAVYNCPAMCQSFFSDMSILYESFL